MASQILIDSAAMEAAISAYGTAKEQKLSAIAAMKAAVDALSGAWQSDASTAFQEQFNALYNTLMNSETIMDDAITDLRSTLNAQIANEQGQKNVIGALETGAPLM
ncbi:MAG: WXG100 family type VII secretion target [Clostridia bacterium]|nr:WXG100 family type VII secretion target [Clostridia bacterium]